MPSPYSYDLRQKVIKAIDGGMSKTQVSSIFKISRNTINTWLHRRRETGDIIALTGYQKGYNPKIPDLEQFRKFAQINGSKTQKEMADEWPDKVSARTISKALKKIGYTRKKKLTVTEKEMKTKERNFWPKFARKGRNS